MTLNHQAVVGGIFFLFPFLSFLKFKVDQQVITSNCNFYVIKS